MASCGTISKEGRLLVSSRCTLIISFHEGCSTVEDLGAVFFTVGFLAVVDFLAAVDLLVALGLLPREDLGEALERAGDFFPTAAATGVGEARGDGRGEDIGRVVISVCTLG